MWGSEDEKETISWICDIGIRISDTFSQAITTVCSLWPPVIYRICDSSVTWKCENVNYMNIFYSINYETKMTIIPTLGIVHHWTEGFDYFNFNAPDNGVFACNLRQLQQQELSVCLSFLGCLTLKVSFFFTVWTNNVSLHHLNLTHKQCWELVLTDHCTTHRDLKYYYL